MYTCIKCEKKIKSMAGIVGHLMSHNLNKNEARNIYYSNYFDLDFDLIKQKYIEGYNTEDLSTEKYSRAMIQAVLDWLKVKKRTASESKKTKIYQKKFETTCIEKYGVINPSQLNSVKKKKEVTMLQNYNRINNFVDTDIRNKALNNRDIKQLIINAKITIQKKYGVDNISHIPFVKEKNKIAKEKYWAKLSIEERKTQTEKARSCILFVSKPELIVQNILNELMIEYTTHQFIAKYNFDIVIKKKIIEIQGDLFHAFPEKYKSDDLIPLINLTAKEVWERDKNKKEKVENKGYKVFYIWENEIRNLTNIQLTEKIKNILYDNCN